MIGISLTREHLICLLIYVLKNPIFGKQCLRKIDSLYFCSLDEQDIRLIWQTLHEYVAEADIIPSEQVLTALVQGRLQQAHLEDDSLTASVKKLIKLIYELKDKEDLSLNKSFINNVLQLLFDRYQKITLEDALQSVNGDTTAFRKVIEEFKKRDEQRILLGTTIADKCRVPIDFFEPKEQQYLTTGIHFLDKMMSGGMLSKEVYVLLGPTGSGKSLLSQQICTMGARQSKASDKGLYIFFSYELCRDDLYNRAFCQLARVTPKRLEQIRKSGASKKFGEQEYEQDLLTYIPSSYGPSEEQRMEEARDILDNYCKLVDLTGNPEMEIPDAGSGGISELVTIIEDLVQQHQSPVKCVVIDWAELCIRKYADKRGYDHFKILVSELGNFVREAHTRIALKFNCPVWVVHQLAGNVLDRADKYHIYHNNAAWCKSFANSAWFSFVLHAPDRAKKATLFSCTKSRRSELPPDAIIKLEPNLVFRDVSTQLKFIPGKGIEERAHSEDWTVFNQ